MRGVLLVGWLCLPFIGAAYHYGPGQEQLKLDATAESISKAQEHAAKGEFAQAKDAYEAALKSLPEADLETSRRLRLERAKADMFCGGLPTSRNELQGLVEELQAEASADPQLLADARLAAANSAYYMTWLLRLEGRPRQDWEVEVEVARQHYRQLAETATDSETEALREQDLAATIHLARADLEELQGLPLPSQ